MSKTKPTHDAERDQVIDTALQIATAAIGQLTDRMLALEALVYDLPDVRRAREARRADERIERLAGVAREQNPITRSALVSKMSTKDRVDLLRIADDAATTIVADADEPLRSELLAYLSPSSRRAAVRVELMVRDGTLPRHLRLTPAQGVTWQRTNRLPIAPAMADKLIAAGVDRVMRERDGSWTFAPWSWQPHDAVLIRREALPLVRDADPRLATGIDENQIKVAELSLDEDRAIAIDRLSTGIVSGGYGVGTVSNGSLGVAVA